MHTCLAPDDDRGLDVAPLGDLPPAARALIGSVLGQEDVSIDDVYVWGGEARANDPWLRRAVLLVVNRRRTKLPAAAARHESPRTLFLLRATRGEYFCGRCVATGTRIAFQPRPGTIAGWRELLPADVRVIGQVTGIVSVANDGEPLGGA